MTTQFQLVLQGGAAPGKSYVLTKAEVTIGRGLNNTIIINDSEVSRRHCRLTMQGDTYLIEDMDSTNGTYVNGEKLKGTYSLRRGDKIGLGEYISLLVEVAQVEEEPEAATQFAEPRPAGKRSPTRSLQFAGRVPHSPAHTEPNLLEKNKTVVIGCTIVLAVICLCVFCAGGGYLLYINGAFASFGLF